LGEYLPYASLPFLPPMSAVRRGYA
jgi:hypothetical protein